MNRRTFIKATGAAGATGALAATGRGGPTVAAQGTPSSGTDGPTATRKAYEFFRHEEMNYNFLMTIGGAFYGVADVGACLAIADQITDGDAASAARAFTAAGDRLAALADEALAAGRRRTALDAYQQAANYSFTTTYFLDEIGAGDQFGPTWLRQQALWSQGAALLDPPAEAVRIPYEQTTLPGWFFKVDDSGARRPLLIFNNGSDGAMTQAWTMGVAPALERGWNCLAFFGPGQGTALVEQQLYFRPDWEKVITPVVDYALSRPEVVAEHTALMGISQGGYWVPRALAFEHRLAAGVADPGVMNVATSWYRFLPPEMRQLLDAGRKAEFDREMAEGVQEDPAMAGMLAFRSRPYSMSSYYDVFKAVQSYNLYGVVGQIRTPLLITDPEGESFWPGQSRELYDALPGPKELVPFTAAEGANLHCEPMAPALRAARIFDWLEATLGIAGRPG